MKKVFFFITAFGLAIAIAFSGINNVAHANSATNSSFTSLTEITEQDVRDFLSKYGVTAENQDLLLEKHYNEQPWDSFSEGVEPIKNYELKTENGIEQVSVYPDGSVSSMIINVPNNSIQGWPNIPLGGYIVPDPDKIFRGSGYVSYRDASVIYNAGVFGCEFKANFTIVQNGNDFIDRVTDGSAIALGTTPQITGLEIIRRTETLDDPAEAKMSLQIYTGSSATAWVKLLISDDYARVITS